MGNLGLGIMELLLIIILLFALSLLPTIFYLLTLQNTLNEVKPENRRMEPGMVWLILIPLFGIVWQFLVVNNIADSLKAEFKQRNITPDEDRPGAGIGLAYCILTCCAIIPFLGVLAALAAFICWIIYWVKISNYKARLKFQV